MATTTNYGWVTPDDTDLVKDGAAAIRTLGTSVDTTVHDNEALAIAKSIVDAKGDIIAATAADTVARLAVGATNGMILTVDSAEATGLKYALPAGGGKVLQVVSASGFNTTTIATTTPTDTGITATITPTSATSKILVLIMANARASRAAGSALIGADVLRGATNIASFGRSDFVQIIATGASAVAISGTFAINKLDAPATTSATTYKVQCSTESSAHEAIWQNGGPSSITLLEIGA